MIILTFEGNLTTVGGILPETGAYVPNSGLVFLSLEDTGKECVTSVNLQGKQVYHYCFANYVLGMVQAYSSHFKDNLAYDVNTKQIFINAYWVSQSKNYIMQLNPTTGILSTVVQVPGIVQVGISTYCPNGHIFFLTLELDDGNTGLVRVDVKNKKVRNPFDLD